MTGLPGQDSIVSGYQLGYDDGTGGVEVAHKTTWGYVAVVNVTISANAYIAGATLAIRDGTGAGNTVWSTTVPALGAAADQNVGFPVVLDAVFETDIRTFLTANAGTMTVSFR